jgi:hypothetical protein
MVATLNRLLHSRWVWAAAGYGAAALAVTFPLGLHLSTHLAGAAGGASDVYEFVWSTWWWPHALFDLGRNPAHITAIQYPTGMRFPLLPLMAQPFVLALPITALAGPVAGYNAMYLLSFVLCGLAGYALCSEVSGSRRAGFVGGLIWTFFPNKLGHAVTGHLFQLVVFAFPLAALAWRRLGQAPSFRRAVWAALALALASTTHPIYLAYFVAPLLAVWLAAAIGRALGAARATPRRPGWLREARWTGLALGLYALLMLPLAAPVALQAARGQLSYLAPESGTVELSLDALSFFVPAPRNPLAAASPLADLARAVVSRENETIGFVGWAALLLAALAVWRHPRASRPWLLLAALVAGLALGPLLKFRGEIVRVPVEGASYAVPLPYALLGNLPFFEWSRSPGRLTITLMLGVAVLAALGLARLEAGMRGARALAARRGLAAGLVLVILVETLVVFPFPLTPAMWPAPVQMLREVGDGRAVLHLPLEDNDAKQRALYWQTLHQLPLIGGRVYRDLPGGDDLARFLAQLLSPPLKPALFPAPAEADSLGLLNTLGVGWVLYDAGADAGADGRAETADSALRAELEARLGAPRAEDGDAALFAVSAGQPFPPVETLVWAAGPGWDAAGVGLRPAAAGATIYVYSPQAGAGQLDLAMRLEAGPARLAVEVNRRPAVEVVLARPQANLMLAAELVSGLNTITLHPRPLRGEAGCACVAMPGVVIEAVDWRWGAAPAPAVVFGRVLELVAYQFALEAQPGETLTLDLDWLTHERSSEVLTFFVHLLDASGGVAAQVDGPPLAGALVTSTWPASALVADRVGLALPASLPPGDYAVAAGWYQWPSLERLVVQGGLPMRDERAILGQVTILPVP